MMRLFKNRVDAGQSLARALRKYANRDDVIVLGLPRGGVPVAYEVAKNLNAPLDVFVVRKLGVPGQRELALAAIATGGVRVINEDIVWQLGLSQLTIDAVTAEERKELARREEAYRGHRNSPVIKNKVVILVDDGIATGSTAQAAVRALRLQKPSKIVVAVPIAAPSSCEMLEREADEVIALMKPQDFYGVGQFYGDFSQMSDDEVTAILARAVENAERKRRMAA